MNTNRKKLIIIGLILLCLFLSKGIIYRSFVKYSVYGKRKSVILTDKRIIGKIDKQINSKVLTLNQIITVSRKITNEELRFTPKKASSNPNILLGIGKANCIGYSALFNSIGIYIIKSQKQTDVYKMNHIVGKLYFLGFDIHRLFSSPFFKDHDFNEIINLKTKKRIYVDPSLSDYLFINRVKTAE